MRAPRAFLTRLAATVGRGGRRIGADERGVTAVEFSLIATPFIGITFAIVEMSLLLFSGQALDTALQDTTRRIMTGQTQTGSINPVQFKAEVCNRMPALVNCAADVFIDVRSYPSAAPAPTLPVNAGNFDPTGFIFKPGGPNCIVVAKAALKYKVYASIWGTGLGTLNDGNRVLMSTVSFRNEPFAMPTPPPCEAS